METQVKPRILNGISLKPGIEKELCLMTINSVAEEVAKWPVFVAVANVASFLRSIKRSDTPNPSQIHAALFRARNGIEVRDTAIFAAPVFPMASDRSYLILADPKKHEISVLIGNLKELQTSLDSESLLASVREAIKQLKRNAGKAHHYVIMKGHLLKAIEDIRQKKLPVPQILLAAVGKPDKTDLPVVVSPDRMRAVVKGFDVALYRMPGKVLDQEWVTRSLGSQKIVFGFENHLRKIIEAIDSHKDLSEMVVAEGTLSAAGGRPFLEAVLQTDTSVEQSTDLRQLQPRKFVSLGQMIARVNYAVPPKVGKDVFGNMLPSITGEVFPVELLRGVEEREKGQFHATCSGVMTITDNSVEVVDGFKHEGDIDMVSGDVSFDGSIEITGSIQKGAAVWVRGNATVNGCVYGYLWASGDVIIKEGIATGSQDRIFIGGNLTAGFIDNSQVICQKRITIQKGIIASKVYCEQEIALNPQEGRIRGGKIICFGDLTAASVGTDSGTMTEVYVGHDWRKELRHQILQARLKRINDALESESKELSELKRKKPDQLTKRHVDLMTAAEERFRRLTELVGKVKAKCEDRQTFVFNKDANISVTKELSLNSTIILADQKLSPTSSLSEVWISVKGTKLRIQPLADKAEKKSGEDEKTSSKPA